MIDYDLIIIGCGPAGMNACLYATRANLKTLVIERQYPGGKVVSADKVENWLGTETINGADLALSMFKHSFSYGGVYEQNNVLDIIDKGDYKEVVLKDKTYKCYAVIIAVGTSERKMGIPGEDKYYGKGVSYCAVCDGSLYKGKEVAVIGNSQHAIEDALYLSEIVNKVYLINEKGNFNVSDFLMNRLKENQKIEIYNGFKVLSINGNESVESITIKKDKDYDLKVSAVFPLIGSSPDSMFASRLKITDDKNYIQVNSDFETNVKGIFAAGDCINKSLKQIVTASSDGAISAIEASKYIKNIKKNK